MCVRALCLVVMVSVDLNCLLWVNHCFLFLFFPGLLFLRIALADFSQDCYKNPTYKALECQFVNLTRL